MIVKCINNPYADNQEVVKHNRPAFSVNPWLSLGKHYIVYAVQFEDNDSIEYLIKTDTGRPFFFPANLFEVIDTQWPHEEWHFGQFQYPFVKDGIVRYFYILGSKEMATDYDLLASMVEHDREGLLHFKEWRKRIDQYEEQRLRTFLTECFPEDWKERYSSWQNAVGNFIQSQSPSNGFLISLSDSLMLYYKSKRYCDDRTIEEDLLLNYGCHYWPSEENQFAKPWLLQLLDMLGQVDTSEFVKQLPDD